MFSWRLAVLLAACPGPSKNGTHAPAPDAAPPLPPARSGDLTIFLTAELLGSLEPCGCTTDPLGYLERTARVMEDTARERPVVFVDGGSTLYVGASLPAGKEAQERLEAEFLAGALPAMGLRAAGLGPADLAEGAAGVRFPRHAVNLDAKAGVPLAPPEVLDVGGVRVGVFGVVAPEAVAAAGLRASDPAAAARDAIAELRAWGAQVIVAIAHMPRAQARKLAREAPGADFVLAGQEVPELGVSAPDAAGGGFVIVPGSKGQVVARLDVHVEAGHTGPLVDAIGEERAKEEIARLGERLAQLDADLAKWEKDAKADPAFVERKRAERAELAASRDALAAQPLRKPERGSWFTLRQVRVHRRLPCSARLVEDKRALDQKIGETNLALAASETAPPAPAGKAGYVGDGECVYCHKKQDDFWKTTRHAGAWATLEKVNKQFNRDCTGCHLTGWLEPGGATLGKNDLLRNVQCETCHGPGSLHVDADGKDTPKSMVLRPADDLCASKCHTPEHSDTFQLEAYLRDVTGKGHGEKLRAKLGKGATGRELRQAALDKAGRDVGEGCPK